MSRDQKKGWLGKFLIHFLIIVIVVIVFIPCYWVLVISLQSAGTFIILEPELIPLHPTLKAFTDALFDSNFLLWMRNSLIVTIPTIILVIFLASPVAFIFSRHRFFGRKPMFLLYILPQVLPVLITLTPLFLIMKELRLLNHTGLIFLYTTVCLPFAIWNLKLYFDTIPKDLDESAYMDGASFLDVLFYIILPLAKPALVATAAISFIICWSEYTIASVFLWDPDQKTLAVSFGAASSTWLHLAIPWPQFAAMALMVTVPFVVFFIASQRYLRAGLVRGALKG